MDGVYFVILRYLDTDHRSTANGRSRLSLVGQGVRWLGENDTSFLISSENYIKALYHMWSKSERTWGRPGGSKGGKKLETT